MKTNQGTAMPSWLVKIWLCIKILYSWQNKYKKFTIVCILLYSTSIHAQKPELVIRTDHTKDPRCVAFSPNGKMKPSVSYDKTIRIWEVVKGEELFSLEGISNFATSFAVNSKRNLLASLDYNRMVTLWDMEKVMSGSFPELVVQTGHGKAVNAVAISTDKKFIASASADNTLKLWDIKTGKEIYTLLGHEGPVLSVAFSPDDKILASASSDKTVKLWNVATGKLSQTISMHTGHVNCVTFSPDGNFLASGGGFGDNDIYIWKTGEMTPAHKLWHHKNDVRAVAFSPDGKSLASAGSDDSILLWDLTLKDPNYAPYVLYGHSKSIYSVAFNPDGKILASGSIDSTIRLWDVQSCAEIRKLSGHANAVWTVVFSPDGKFLVSGSADSTIKFWDIENGSVFYTLRDNLCSVYSLSISSDGRLLASGGDDWAIKLWDVNKKLLLKDFRSHAANISCVAISPDGRSLASGSWRTIKLWDLRVGKATGLLYGHEKFIGTIAFNPVYKIIASVDIIGDDRIIIWQEESQQPIAVLSGHDKFIYSLDFSPDGNLLASSSADKSIKIWDVHTFKEIWTLQSEDLPVSHIAFHPNGTVLASSSLLKNVIKFWDVKTGVELGAYYDQSGLISYFTFNSDGSQIAISVHLINEGAGKIKILDWQTGKEISSCGYQPNIPPFATYSPDSKTIIARTTYSNDFDLFDTNTGNLLHRFSGHADAVTSVAFSPNGRLLASSSNDAKVKLWDLTTGREIANLIAIDFSEYIITTPDNYYSASKGAFEGIAFRSGNKIYPFEQFDLRLNRPDIVLQRIGLAPKELIDAYYQAYHKRLKKMNFTETMLGDDFHLPEVILLTENLPVTSNNKMLNFKIKAFDSKYLLDRLNIFVNDVPIYGINGINLRNKKLSTYERDITLELCEDRNKIQTSVLNEKGAESLKETFEIIYNGEIIKPDLYIIAVGVSEYMNRSINLRYAAKDAEDLAKLFGSQVDRFNKIHSFTLLNQDATREKIMGIKEVFLKSKVDDQVVVFMSGHGLLDKNSDYYFATTDIDITKPAIRGLPYDAIEDLLDGIPARKKLLLMDTCHSGEVDKEDTVATIITDRGAKAPNVKVYSFKNVVPLQQTKKIGLSNSFLLMQELFANLSRGSGAMVISAASGVEFAIEDEKWRNGVFTFSLLEGLETKKADANGDREIRVSELKEYVTKKVKELTNGRQTPTSRRENLEFDFRVF